MKWKLILFCMVLSVLFSNAPSFAFTAPAFSDVHTDSPFYPYVEKVRLRGWTSGCGNGAFCPQANINRAQFAVWAVLGAHRNDASWTLRPATGIFFDVPASSFYAPWIEEAARLGITAGCDFDSMGHLFYCPDGIVTRKQVATMLLVAANRATNPVCVGEFDDVDCNDPYGSWAEEAVRQGVMGLCGPRLFCDDEPVPRAQMMVFIVKAFGF